MKNYMKTIIFVFTKESRYRKINIKNKKILFIVFIILISICIDQIVKQVIIKNILNSSIEIINGVLNFTYVENTGGAYGIGSNNILMFIIINVIIIGILMKFVISKRDEINNALLIAISLIIAGGIGNLIDRIFRGYVIDFIDINPVFKYPVFNIADIFVVTGCIVIAIDLIYRTIKSKN